MIRPHGVVENATGLVPFAHLGWGYRNRGEFLTRAAEYIAEGQACNQWIEYVGAGTRDQLRAELDTIPLDTSDVTATPALEFYQLSDYTDVVDLDAVLAARSATIEKATALGYDGVRVIADPTAVTATPEQRDTFTRLEFAFDQTMAGAPISALCAYDTSRQVGNASELICMHPLVGGASTAFRLYAETGAAFALEGEIDAATAGIFTTTLQRICPMVDGDEVIIDAECLGFITHRELRALDEQARRNGRTIVMRGSSPLLARLAELIELTNVRVEPA